MTDKLAQALRDIRQMCAAGSTRTARASHAKLTLGLMARVIDEALADSEALAAHDAGWVLVPRPVQAWCRPPFYGAEDVLLRYATRQHAQEAHALAAAPSKQEQPK
jgi:hypothetical protein